METDVQRIRVTGLHSGQAEVAASTARYRVLCCGRRWGKTRLAVGLALFEAMNGGRVWWVAPTSKLAGIGWRELLRYARRVPGVEKRLTEKLLTFPSGGSLQVRTAGEPGGLRGEGLDFVVYDEAAMGPEESWNAELRPALTDRHGRALIISTPKGRNSWFYRLWLRGQQPGGEWKSWRFPTASNPTIPDLEAELKEAESEMPLDVFEQEFLAEFNDAGTSPFKQADIEAMADGWEGLSMRGQPDRDYVTAWDIGYRGDATVGLTIDTTRVPYQVITFDREVRMPTPAQQSMIEGRTKAYPGVSVVEENNALALIDNLNVRVTPFVTTARSKVKALQALAMLLERGALKCGVHEVLLELREYQWDDKGLVQDCVMALAIAALHCPPVGLEVNPEHYNDFELDLAGVGGTTMGPGGREF